MIACYMSNSLCKATNGRGKSRNWKH